MSDSLSLQVDHRVLSDRAVEIARSWIGTPYHHQMAAKGLGCDCLGLVRGVYRELYGKEAEKPPPYDPSWAEISFREDLLGAAERHLVRLPASVGQQVGNVVVFRMFERSAAKHCGIVSAPGRMIHAYDPHGVCETQLNDWWLRKIVGTFKFKEE